MARQSDLDLLKCSFCGKRNEQVKKLIAGPSVYICNECIDICNEIIENDILDEELSETSHLKLEVQPTPQDIHRLLETGQFTEEEEKVLRLMTGRAVYYWMAGELGLGEDVVRQAARRIFQECSFCEKSHNQVSRLVAGAGVYICNECIELCGEIIEEELSEPSGLDVEEPLTPKRQIDPRTFTEQELQVLKLMTQGASEDMIAEEVGTDILGQTLAKVSGSCGGRNVPMTQTSSSRGQRSALPCPQIRRRERAGRRGGVGRWHEPRSGARPRA